MLNDISETIGAAQPARTLNSTALPRMAFTMREMAAILGISYITIHRLLKRGLLKSAGGIRRKLIPASEIDRYLNATLS